MYAGLRPHLPAFPVVRPSLVGPMRRELAGCLAPLGPAARGCLVVVFAKQRLGPAVLVGPLLLSDYLTAAQPPPLPAGEVLLQLGALLLQLWLCCFALLANLSHLRDKHTQYPGSRGSQPQGERVQEMKTATFRTLCHFCKKKHASGSPALG